MTQTKEKVNMSLRLDADTVEQLKAQAAKERRSVNNLIEIAILDYIATRLEPTGT